MPVSLPNMTICVQHVCLYGTCVSGFLSTDILIQMCMSNSNFFQYVFHTFLSCYFKCGRFVHTNVHVISYVFDSSCFCPFSFLFLFHFFLVELCFSLTSQYFPWFSCISSSFLHFSPFFFVCFSIPSFPGSRWLLYSNSHSVFIGVEQLSWYCTGMSIVGSWVWFSLLVAYSLWSIDILQAHDNVYVLVYVEKLIQSTFILMMPSWHFLVQKWHKTVSPILSYLILSNLILSNLI